METIKAILFVCTSNTCRSVMAEYLFKDMIEKSEDFKLENWKIISAGISAVKDAAANDKVQAVMAEIGIDISDHLSRNINEVELEEKDLIFTMTRKHSRALILRHPALADKIFTLKEFSDLDSDKLNSRESNCDEQKDIIDPFGLSEEFYRETREEIKHNLKKLLKKMRKYDFEREV